VPTHRIYVECRNGLRYKVASAHARSASVRDAKRFANAIIDKWVVCRGVVIIVIVTVTWRLCFRRRSGLGLGLGLVLFAQLAKTAAASTTPST
jgi:hypothetical protein